MRRGATIAGLFAAVVAVAAAMTAGPHTGPVGVPPSDPGAWAGWLADQPPEAVAFAVVRLAVVALAGHTAALVAVALVAGAARRPVAARAIEHAAAPGARTLVRWAVAAGLTLATVAGPAAASSGPLPVVAAEATADDPPVIRRLDDEPPAPAAPVPTTAEWVVRPGDHLWAVAEATLAASLGRAPSDHEVAPYWVQVVEANRTRLADPANPDLVYPGQVLAVPPLPPPPPPA